MYLHSQKRISSKEQLRLWRSGASAWNAWRRRHRAHAPDFSKLRTDILDENFKDLSKFDLSGASFQGGYFYGVDFRAADLSSTNARHAIFEHCDFTDTNLTEAWLNDATLFFCTFTNADVRRASFDRTLLRYTEFNETKFGGAQFGETDFIAAKFTKVTGLSKAAHRAPSMIDLATLAQPLPRKFLRGIGLSEATIDARSTLGDFKGEYRSCFIGYSAKDERFAGRLYDDLQERGVRCWFAPHNLPIGAKTLHDIDRQIARLDCLLLILSANSLASAWVEDEVNKAFAEERRRRGLVLMPVRIDDKVMSSKLAWAAKLRDQRNIGSFVGWHDVKTYKRSLTRLLNALKK